MKLVGLVLLVAKFKLEPTSSGEELASLQGKEVGANNRGIKVSPLARLG